MEETNNAQELKEPSADEEEEEEEDEKMISPLPAGQAPPPVTEATTVLTTSSRVSFADQEHIALAIRTAAAAFLSTASSNDVDTTFGGPRPVGDEDSDATPDLDNITFARTIPERVRKSFLYMPSENSIDDPPYFDAPRRASEIWATLPARNSSFRKLRSVSKKKTRLVAVGSIVLVLVISIGVTLGIVLNKNDQVTEAPTEAPTATPRPCDSIPTPIQEDCLMALFQSVSPNTEFTNSSSPQSLALQWMLSDEYAKSSNLTDEFLIQRFVLATMWYSTDGPNWLPGHIWLGPNPEHGWGDPSEFLTLERDFGVFPETGLGIWIDLSRNGLSESIPREIGLLVHLVRLDFWGNSLSGTIPTEMGWMTALTELDLSYNILSGSIPTELGLLTQLTRLDLSINSLTGSIPSSIAKLTLLRLVRLNGNSFTGSIPLILCNNSAIDLEIDCGEIECSCCKDGNRAESPPPSCS